MSVASPVDADVSDEPPVNVKKNKIVNKSKPSGGPVQLGAALASVIAAADGDVGPPVDDVGPTPPVPAPIPTATAAVPATEPAPPVVEPPALVEDALDEAPERDVRADSKMRAITDSEDMVTGEEEDVESESAASEEEDDGYDDVFEREYDEDGNFIEPGSKKSLYPKTFHDRFDCAKLQELEQLVRENI